MLQIAAVFQLIGFQGRVLAVEAALDVVAEDEGHAAGAVVGAGAVVHGPPPEFRVEEQCDVVALTQLPDVGHE